MPPRLSCGYHMKTCIFFKIMAEKTEFVEDYNYTLSNVSALMAAEESISSLHYRQSADVMKKSGKLDEISLNMMPSPNLDSTRTMHGTNTDVTLGSFSFVPQLNCAADQESDLETDGFDKRVCKIVYAGSRVKNQTDLQECGDKVSSEECFTEARVENASIDDQVKGFTSSISDTSIKCLNEGTVSVKETKQNILEESVAVRGGNESDDLSESYEGETNDKIQKGKDNSDSKRKEKPKLEESDLTCKECGKIVKSIRALDRHMNLHTGKYTCDVCQKICNSEFSLRSHTKIHQGFVGDQVCNVCDKKFFDKSSLNKHTLSVHMGIRNFQCQYCSLSFYARKTYEEHVRVHTGERPFKCDQCPKTYKRIADLNHHLRLHKGNEHLNWFCLTPFHPKFVKWTCTFMLKPCIVSFREENVKLSSQKNRALIIMID